MKRAGLYALRRLPRASSRPAPAPFVPWDPEHAPVTPSTESAPPCQSCHEAPPSGPYHFGADGLVRCSACHREYEAERERLLGRLAAAGACAGCGTECYGDDLFELAGRDGRWCRACHARGGGL